MMLDGGSLVDAFLSEGCQFFTGVPDSVLGGFARACEKLSSPSKHVVAANEGNAIALATGWWFSRQSVPVVYLQNSGIGNAVNPLVSLAHAEVFAVPMVLLVGWRGQPGSIDEPQHLVQGRVTKGIFDLVDIRCLTLDTAASLDAVVAEAVGYARTSRSPVAITVPRGLVSPDKPREPAHQHSELSRSEALEIIIASIPADEAIVGSTGYISRDLYDQFGAAGRTTRQLFLAAGSMGHASQIACGVALGDQSRRVWCVDGDGALLMHLGGIACIGTMRPENFVHIVLDNGVHASVGASSTCAPHTKFATLARQVGYRQTFDVSEPSTLRSALRDARSIRGPVLIQVSINVAERRSLGRPNPDFRAASAAFEEFLAL